MLELIKLEDCLSICYQSILTLSPLLFSSFSFFLFSSYSLCFISCSPDFIPPTFPFPLFSSIPHSSALSLTFPSFLPSLHIIFFSSCAAPLPRANLFAPLPHFSSIPSLLLIPHPWNRQHTADEQLNMAIPLGNQGYSLSECVFVHVHDCVSDEAREKHLAEMQKC